MTKNKGNNDWTTQRAALDREVLDCKEVITRYKQTPRPYRDVTDSEYAHARKRLIEAATEIKYGDYEAAKPADPYASMSLAQLRAQQEAFNKELAERREAGGRASGEDFAKVMTLAARIQALAQQEGAGDGE